jgi:CheY-like chemotaxis protein
MVERKRNVTPETGTVRVLVVKSFWVEKDIVSPVLEEHLGWEVLVASRGDMALEILEKQSVHLMITDVAMSNDYFNGFGLIRHIRYDQNLSVPIMVVTNRMAPEIRETALDLKVDAFITVPFEEDYLVSKALELVKGKLTADS